MAIKVNAKGQIIKVTPSDGKYFNIDMLERVVGGWPEPTKIGPVWIITNEEAKKDSSTYNEIASTFFKVPIYGDLLSLSALELPPEWDLVDEFDSKFTVDEIDAGFVKSLYDNALLTGFDSPMDPWNAADPFASLTNDNLYTTLPKAEYFYNPNKPKNPETSDENYINFLRDSYEHIVKNSKENFKDFIMYEDDINVIRVKSKEDRIKTINQVMNILLEDEEYEKCAVLRDILSNQFEKA